MAFLKQTEVVLEADWEMEMERSSLQFINILNYFLRKGVCNSATVQQCNNETVRQWQCNSAATVVFPSDSVIALSWEMP